MSRLERERWAMGGERWPHLQRFLSVAASNVLFGDARNVSAELREKVDCIEASERLNVASECWDFLTAFKDRHDDRGFLRDGFGVSGAPPADDRGRGQAALSRMKLLYDALAEAVRAQHPDWKPEPEKQTGR